MSEELTTDSTVLDLALYDCHKQVRAGEITEIVAAGCYVRMTDGTSVLLPYANEMTSRYEPKVGDFWVFYLTDGYQSISPRRTFLDGYRLASDAETKT